MTTCNEDNGEVTAAFIRAKKPLRGWEAQIRFGIGPQDEGGTIVGVHLDAPPAREEALPPLDGEVAPCWRQ